MVTEWTNSEKLSLLISYKAGLDWLSIANKLNENYSRERPANFFSDKLCKTEFESICNESCPKPVSPDEPLSSFKRNAVIDAWIAHLKEQVRIDIDKSVELSLVELRRESELIERIMRGERPPVSEMKAMLAARKEEDKKKNRDPAQIARVEAAFRVRVLERFAEQRASAAAGAATEAPPTLDISPTKPSSIDLQQAFRSPSPLRSPIRPLAETIEEADAEMVDVEPIEIDTDLPAAPPVEPPPQPVEVPPVSSPLAPATSSVDDTTTTTSPEKKSPKRENTVTPTVSPTVPAAAPVVNTVSPRTEQTLVGLEEELEEVDIKNEPMESDDRQHQHAPQDTVDEPTAVMPPPVVEKKRRGRQPAAAAASQAAEPTTPSRRKKESTPSEVKEEKESSSEEPFRGRRHSTRKSTTSVSESSSVGEKTKKTTDKVKDEGAKKEKDGSVSGKEIKDEKKEEDAPSKRATRRNAAATAVDDKEVKEKDQQKDEATFAMPAVATRTRHHRVSEQNDEKDKSEEAGDTTISRRSSRSGAARESSAASPVPSPGPGRRRKVVVEEKKDDERGHKEPSKTPSEKGSVTSIATSSNNQPTRKDVEVLTEVSIRHYMVAALPMTSPTKAKRTADQKEKETSGTPTLTRKSSRMSTTSSGRKESTTSPVVTASVEIQTDRVEMKSDDEVHVTYDGNENAFHPVYYVDKTASLDDHLDSDDDMPLLPARHLRGSELTTSSTEGIDDDGDDDKDKDSTTVTTTSTSSPLMKKRDSKREQMTVVLDVDTDTGRYWLGRGGALVVDAADAPSEAASAAPPPSKRGRSSMAAPVSAAAPGDAPASSRRSDVGKYESSKNPLTTAVKELYFHRHSSVFAVPVSKRDVPDYYEHVKFPIYLGKLKEEAMNGTINDSLSLKRKLCLMFMNAVMYNSTGHDVHRYAQEMHRETQTNQELISKDGVKLTRGRKAGMPAFAVDATPHDASSTPFIKSEDVDYASGEELSPRVTFARSKVETTRKRPVG